jgi:hypothetical protein
MNHLMSAVNAAIAAINIVCTIYNATHDKWVQASVNAAVAAIALVACIIHTKRILNS